MSNVDFRTDKSRKLDCEISFGIKSSWVGRIWQHDGQYSCRALKRELKPRMLVLVVGIKSHSDSREREVSFRGSFLIDVKSKKRYGLV